MRDSFRGQTTRVISASAVLKPRAGRIARLHISGAAPNFLQARDSATVGAGTELFTALPASITPGATFDLDIPCRSGVTVMMGTGAITVVYS